MNSNEQVRPFAFPGPGKGLKPSVNIERAEPELQVMAGRSRRRQKDSGWNDGDKGRLRQFVTKRQPEPDESGNVALRPAFAVAVEGEGAKENRKPMARLRRKGSEALSVSVENASESVPDGKESSEALSQNASGSDLQSASDDVESVEELRAPEAKEVPHQADVDEEPDVEATVETDSTGISASKNETPSDLAATNSDIDQSTEVAGKAAPSVPPSTAAAALQKAMDDMFQKGLEQGRQEALNDQAKVVHQQAFDQGVESGRQTGYEEGLQQGLSAAADELSHRFAGIEALIHEMEEHRRLLSRQQVMGAARLLERLVIEVVRTELRHSPEQIQAVVEEAVHLLDRTDHESIALRVHPDDAAWLQGFVQNSSEAFVVRPDPAITRGGCRIEGRLGHVDATLEERLTDCIEQLRTCLLEDPLEAPPVDISPVYDRIQPKKEVHSGAHSVAHSNAVTASSGRLSPEPELPSAELSAVAQRPAVPASDSFFGSEASGQSGLGAWGDLGQ
ncbi:hypothetical protein GZ77_06080 [Endozoicomonas montiporae]|uniref:Flagellar assembly protein FliH n=2 Tax=Endozoicomonas montiporae TaxID=1027273 RepID=A0A081NC58_9GAMM|nr:FliH/SctL family protein [Endozoicomonas montiporae]AMO56361.1 flagellar assembly protein H [Endozoicomonas montiporae CL-33]KEQ16031.1 hypothetical protein GZ77_06080 [Endozoicomonas montiporae]